MEALILAAGYATRLYPLTRDTPKALLPIGKKCMLSFILEGLKTIPSLEKVYIVTNDRFTAQFEAWVESADISPLTVEVINDGTKGNEDRLGALGDVQFALENAQIDDDLLVMASDNFFTFPLSDFVDAFHRTGKDTLLAGHIYDTEELRRFAVAVLDEEGTVKELVEKPKEPKTTIAIYAMYCYRRDTLPLFKQYIDEGNPADSPGFFPQWLHKRKEVKVWLFRGDCVDIGTHETYRAVCEKYGGEA
ncbi:MAG: nucleotidyltransferase family protein [Christensenellales bacterium]